MASAEYPKSMYKGSFDHQKINGDVQVVSTLEQEKLLRSSGFVDGHEFFSPKPVVPAPKDATPQINKSSKSA